MSKVGLTDNNKTLSETRGLLPGVCLWGDLPPGGLPPLGLAPGGLPPKGVRPPPPILSSGMHPTGMYSCLIVTEFS